MAITYEELRRKQQEEFNKFPIGAAFSNEQLDNMMRKWGLTSDDTDKILSIGAGCFIRKSDRAAFREMVNRHSAEMKEAMKDMKFFKSAALYEMCNHEYGINWQADWDVITALGFYVEYSDGKELECCTKMTDGQKEAYLEARREYFKLAEKNEWY